MLISRSIPGVSLCWFSIAYAASHSLHGQMLLAQGLSVSLCKIEQLGAGIDLLLLYTMADILGQHGFSRLSIVHAFT